MKQLSYSKNDEQRVFKLVLLDLQDSSNYKKLLRDRYGVDIDVLKKYAGIDLHGTVYSEVVSTTDDPIDNEMITWVEVKEIKEYKAVPLMLLCMVN